MKIDTKILLLFVAEMNDVTSVNSGRLRTTSRVERMSGGASRTRAAWWISMACGASSALSRPTLEASEPSYQDML